MQKKNYYGERIHIQGKDQATQEEIGFYTEFATTIVKAEVKVQSTKQQRDFAMNQYNSIAFNYEDQGDFATAAYFYQRVVELSVTSNNKQFQLVALLGLGKCYDQTQRKN